MKKMSKLIALLLALVMLLSCMTACGKKEAPEVEEPPAAAEPEKPVETPEEPEAPEADTEESYLPLVKDGDVTLTIGIQHDVDVVDYETNAYTLWLEETSGINLEFVYFSADNTEAAQQLALMMNAGEKLPDIIHNHMGISQAASFEYGEDGYFIDLLPLIEEYGYYYPQMKATMDSQADASMLEAYGIDAATGALYGMPSYQISGGSPDLISNHLMINKTWLDAVGEEVPTTVDELVNVLTKFVNEDPNGNGVKDEMGMSGIVERSRGNILEYVINAYVFNEDEYMYNVDENGNIYFPYATDEYRQAMIKLNEMFDAGLINPLSFTMKEDAEMMALFTPADGVPLTGVAAGHPVLITAEGGTCAFDFVGLPALAAETELGGYLPHRSATFNWRTFITEDCEDPVLAFKLIDLMYSEDSLLRMRWGEYGVDWEYAPEGAVNAYGQPVKLWTINAAAFSGQNNCTWHELGNMILDYSHHRSVAQGFDPNAPIEEAGWSTRVAYWYNTELCPVWYASPEKEDLYFRTIYNAEENEVVTEYETLFKQYVEEARALFVTGTLDPNSDADWETYLNNLEANGMSKLVEATQAAYSRTAD